MSACTCTAQMYEHEHHKTMTSDAIAAMVSTMLYYRRFFPYYVYNIVAGLDEEGRYRRGIGAYA